MHRFKFYSPEEQINHSLFTEKGIEVFIKRDDLIHPFISGNKWRKLKYVFEQAGRQNKKHLVTFGGAYSNHLLATACAAAKFGFITTGFVRGEQVENEILFLCRTFGMTLIFTDRESYRHKEKLFSTGFENDSEAFFIDEGGASREAAAGCEEIISELKQDYNHIFCACGTGTTAAGIINGINNNRLAAKFCGVTVLKGGEFLETEIEKYLYKKSSYCLQTDYHFGGYAKTKPELTKFIQKFASSTGILLDPVYTGKMMYAVFDLIGKDYFSQGDRILAVHTGGLFGLLGMRDKFVSQ
jgi:1-aminocyclopropane-1-carboxylate deaminase